VESEERAHLGKERPVALSRHVEPEYVEVDTNMRNLIGSAVVVVGTIVVGFSPRRWDTVILDLPRGHGIHTHDLLGLALVVAGIAVLWRTPRRI